MTDVLICGAGPTGLTVAVELARRGVAVRIVERNSVPPTDARALIVKPSTLHAAEQLGILDEVLAQCVPADVVEYSYEGRPVALAVSPDERWPWSINLGEDQLVPILSARLEGLGVVIERGLEVIDIEHRDGAVRTVLRDRAGDEQTIDIGWLVGCDGVHSIVRQNVGIAYDGHDSAVHWHVLDAQVDGWPYKDGHGMIFLDLPLMTIYRTKVAFRIYTISHQATGPSWAAARDYLRDRVPTARLGPPISDTAFRAGARIAASYRAGRVLLCGDAAHSMSPGSAAGLNVGIQDAVNLGWKLAAVVRGQADGTLLDTYQGERRPTALEMIEIGEKNDDLFTLADPAERSRAIRKFAVTMSAYLRGGGNGYEKIMGVYGSSTIAVGERPDHGPAPGQHLAPDIRLRRVNGDNQYLTGALVSPCQSILVFVGDGGLEAEQLVRSAIDLCGQSNGALDLCVVARDVDGATARLALEQGADTLLVDPDLDGHNRLGVAERSALWIRPDGRIGSRIDDANDVAPLRAQIGTALSGLVLGDERSS